MVRALSLTLTALAGLCVPLLAAEAPAPAPTTVTAPADRVAPLAAVVELAIAGGLPDAKGATLHRGKLGVIWRHDATNKNVNQVNGLHAKLADGRWLVGLQTLKNAADLEIDENQVKPIASDALLATMGENSARWITPEAIDGMIAQIKPSDRDRVRAAASALPVVMDMFQGGVEPAVAVAHLIRLEAPCAHDVAVLAGLWSGSGMNPHILAFAGPASPLVLSADEQDWDSFMSEEPDEVTVPDPAVSLRQGLFLHFRSLAIGGASRMNPFAPSTPSVDGVAPDVALAAAATLLTPADTAAHADLALLRGRAALPEKVAADAPLADRLAVWDGALASAEQKDGEEGIPTGGFHQSDHEATALIASEADFDPLFALLDDPRPCRWLDRGRARTLGDNALRAIGALFCCDPRSFIARDPAAPWTAEERAATVAALRAWRISSKGRALDDILVEAVPTMKPADLARLLAARPPTRRAPLLAAAAKAWAAAPPANADDDAIAAVIAAAGDDAGLLAVIAAWPVAGDLAPLLAAFHLTRGNAAPLDALLTATLADAQDGMHLYQVVPLACYAPTPALLTRLSEALRGPLDDMPGQMLLGVVLNGMNSGELDFLTAWATRQANGDEDAAKRRRQTLPLALYAGLLADDRALTPQLKQEAEQMRAHLPQRAGKPAAKAELAADLRVADYAGSRFQMMGWQLSEVLGDGLRERAEELAVDLTKPIAERDRQLSALRRDIAGALAPALEAAALPNLGPGIGPSAGDEKALF
mgnify:CR=1 FL=1